MAFKNLAFLSLVLLATPVVAEEADADVALIFSEMDTDKDGSLSLAEFGGLSGEDHGMSAEELAKAKEEVKADFEKLDEDKNGRLNQTELAKDTEGVAPEEDDMSAMEDGAEEQDAEEGTEGEGDSEEDQGMEEGTEDEDEADEPDDAGLLEEGEMTEEQAAEQMMASLDTNKDGSLSLQEYSTSENSSEPLSKEDLAEAKKEFDDLDEDKNGQISKAELAKQKEEPEDVEVN